ncbi:MAG TPA: ABC transporter permease [Vicinamibacterales bacterium]
MYVANFARNARFAFRILHRNITYTLAVTVTMALALGAATTIFALVNVMFLRPLPFADPERLVTVSSILPGSGGRDEPFAVSELELARWRSATQTLEHVGGLQPRSVAVLINGEPELVRAAGVTSELLPLLGVMPAQGRFFTDEEARSGAHVAVASTQIARRLFPSMSSPVGAALTIDGQVYEIVGMMPVDYRPLLDESEIWIPLNPTIDPTRANQRITAGAARLRAGATMRQAEAELANYSAELAREFPLSHGHARPAVISLRENLYGDKRPALVAMFMAALLLVLLACANIANLTVGHMNRRRSELWIRTAIGASRSALVHQQLVETIMLAACGTAGALLLAAWAMPLLSLLMSKPGTGRVDATIDWRVFAFTACFAIAASVGSSIAPMLRLARRDAADAEASMSGDRAGVTPGQRRLSGTLLGLQAGFATVLLAGAIASLTSVQRLAHASAGFRSDNVLDIQLAVAPGKYTSVEQRSRYVSAIVDRVAAIPGIVSVGTTQATFVRNESMQTLIWADDRPQVDTSAAPVNIRHITDGYFGVLDVRMQEGRSLDRRDQLGTTPVCVVSSTLARAFWSGHSAIGHRIRRISANAQWMTIVGVATDVTDAGVGQTLGPTLYVPYVQTNTATARISVLIRTHGDPLSVAPSARAAIVAAEPQQPIGRVATLDTLLDESVMQDRIRALLVAAFAFVGLVVAVLGVYAVTAADVTSRTRELGVRLALGATPSELIRQLLATAVGRVGAGVVAGTLGYLALARAATALLYQTNAAAPSIIAGSAFVLLVGGVLAAVVCARSIVTLTPVSVLRSV